MRPSPAAEPNDPPLGSLREMKEKLRQKRQVTDEMLQALKKIHKATNIKNPHQKEFRPLESGY
jgi:hypothetical protein